MGDCMRKLFVVLLMVAALSACDKHDPILPGTRTAIFNSASISVAEQTITDVPDTMAVVDNSNCKYTQDSSNVIF